MKLDVMEISAQIDTDAAPGEINTSALVLSSAVSVECILTPVQSY